MDLRPGDFVQHLTNGKRYSIEYELEGGKKFLINCMDETEIFVIDTYFLIKDYKKIPNIINNKKPEVKTDFEQWKEWLDKWEIEYIERSINDRKNLIIPGLEANTRIKFDKQEKFVYVTSFPLFRR